MTVSLRDARAIPGDQHWISRAYSDYMEDLDLLNTGVFAIPGEFSGHQPDPVQRWLLDRAALLITIVDAGQPAGFAMVKRETHGMRAADYCMVDFFIARMYRRRGLGRGAARLMLDRFAGSWEIIQHTRNPGAVEFWRKVVAGYTRGDYRERSSNGEIRQYFTSPRERVAGR